MGVEILSPLFGTLYPGFYWAAHEDFSYQHRPQSQAHIPRDQGDFYYMGAFFGGGRSVADVHQLTLACHQAVVVDLASGIEAVWRSESHLNRYLLDHKPIKVLPGRTCGTHGCWAGPPRPPGHEEAEIWAMPKNHQDTQNA